MSAKLKTSLTFNQIYEKEAEKSVSSR